MTRERKKVWVEYANTCALTKVYEELVAETSEDEEDSKRYNVSKANKERYGSPEGTHISKETLKRADFRLKLKSLLSRYATLKTREYFWHTYTPFSQFEYYHDTPQIYRLGSVEEGIRVPEMTEDWARLLIEVTFWRIKYNDLSLKKVRKGSFMEQVPVPKGVKREIEKREVEMVGKGWVL